MLAAIYPTLQGCARQHNTTTPPVARLPTELLTNAFALLAFRDRVSASLVCQAWRAASLGAARLWSVVRNERRPWVLAPMLARCGTTPVDLFRISIVHENICDMATCLAEHMSHVRTLIVALDADELDTTVLVQALQKPAPLLAYFAIEDYGRNDLDFQRRLFAGTAPALRSVLLQSDYANVTGCAALSGIRRLSYEGEMFDPKQLGVTFATCPNLDTLVVRMGVFDPTNYPVERWPPDTPFTPPETLKRLAILGTDESFTAYPAFAFIQHRAVPDLCLCLPKVRWLDQDDGQVIVSRLTHLPLRAVDMRCKRDHVDVRVLERTGHTRSYHGLPRSRLEEVGLGAHVFFDITSLSIRGIRFTRKLATLVLRSLQQLTVVVDSDFQFPARDEPLLDCPVLRTVCLSSASEVRTLQAEDAAAALRAILREGHILALLEFHGIDVPKVDGAAALDLAIFADEITHSPAPLDLSWTSDFVL